MNVPTIDASGFVATKWDTPEDKAKGADALLRFMFRGYRWSMFSGRVYDICNQHLYGHIAHFNRSGFYGTWFLRDVDRLAFIERAIRADVYGSPEHTWSDVERALQMHPWLGREAGRLRADIDADHELAERSELARLKSKYEGGV